MRSIKLEGFLDLLEVAHPHIGWRLSQPVHRNRIRGRKGQCWEVTREAHEREEDAQIGQKRFGGSRSIPSHHGVAKQTFLWYGQSCC